jgi:hypothetical protein
MGYLALKLETRGAYRVLVGKPEKKRLLGGVIVDVRMILK